MKCRQCGTEIADKALICYRCGTPTTDAKYQPFTGPEKRSRLPIVIGVALVALLVIAAWFLLHS